MSTAFSRSSTSRAASRVHPDTIQHANLQEKCDTLVDQVRGLRTALKSTEGKLQRAASTGPGQSGSAYAQRKHAMDMLKQEEDKRKVAEAALKVLREETTVKINRLEGEIKKKNDLLVRYKTENEILTAKLRASSGTKVAEAEKAKFALALNKIHGNGARPGVTSADRSFNGPGESPQRTPKRNVHTSRGLSQQFMRSLSTEQSKALHRSGQRSMRSPGRSMASSGPVGFTSAQARSRQPGCRVGAVVSHATLGLGIVRFLGTVPSLGPGAWVGVERDPRLAKAGAKRSDGGDGSPPGRSPSSGQQAGKSPVSRSASAGKAASSTNSSPITAKAPENEENGYSGGKKYFTVSRPGTGYFCHTDELRPERALSRMDSAHNDSLVSKIDTGRAAETSKGAETSRGADTGRRNSARQGPEGSTTLMDRVRGTALAARARALQRQQSSAPSSRPNTARRGSTASTQEGSGVSSNSARYGRTETVH